MPFRLPRMMRPCIALRHARRSSTLARPEVGNRICWSGSPASQAKYASSQALGSSKLRVRNQSCAQVVRRIAGRKRAGAPPRPALAPPGPRARRPSPRAVRGVRPGPGPERAGALNAPGTMSPDHGAAPSQRGARTGRGRGRWGGAHWRPDRRAADLTTMWQCGRVRAGEPGIRASPIAGEAARDSAARSPPGRIRPRFRNVCEDLSTSPISLSGST